MNSDKSKKSYFLHLCTNVLGFFWIRAVCYCRKSVFSRVGKSLIGFWLIHLFFVSKRAKERFACEKEQIAHSCSFVMSNMSKSLAGASLLRAIGVNRSSCSLKNEQRATGAISSWAQKRQKTDKDMQKYEFFEQITRFLRALCSNHEQINPIVFFLKEWREGFAHITLL